MREAGNQALGASPLPFRVCINKNLEMEAELKFKPKHIDMGCRLGKQQLNHFTKCLSLYSSLYILDYKPEPPHYAEKHSHL